MTTLVKGIHHITLCPGPAQEDLEFYSQVLGQRLVKQTVLMDGRIPIYHFYWGNADAEIGSIATSFPYSRKAGRAGSGQISVTSYAVPNGSAPFWKEHFARHAVEHGDIQERFGTTFVRVRHPAGMLFEVVEAHDERRPWLTTQISADVATRGFFGAVMSVRSIEEQEQFLVEALGFRKLGVDGAYHRFEAPRTWSRQHHRSASRTVPSARHLDVRRRHRASHRLQCRNRRGPGRAEGVVRRARLHRCLGHQGSLLLPLDVRAIAGRRPGRVHGQRARRLLPATKRRRTWAGS